MQLLNHEIATKVQTSAKILEIYRLCLVYRIILPFFGDKKVRVRVSHPIEHPWS